MGSGQHCGPRSGVATARGFSTRGEKNMTFATNRGNIMKAIVQNAYGSPDVLELREIDKPVVKDDDVLVRVHAAAIHSGDYFGMRGVPYAIRLYFGFPKPKDRVPGIDVAGHVEAVGKNVTRFQPGDEVFGAPNGACAEYACARDDKFVPKPANLTFEQAAAVPTSAVTALRGLRNAGEVQPGQKVLINGASGGVGTFAVQIAKALGAEVTGVCSTRNVEMVQSIGADHVIDYTQEDFTQGGPRYDLILDNVGNHSFSDCRRALTPRGTLQPNTGHAGPVTSSRRSCCHRSCASRGARSLRSLSRNTWLL